MPRSVDRASAAYIMREMGYETGKEEGPRAEYRTRMNEYESPVVLFFPEGGIPEEDFREALERQGIPLAVIDAALEQQ